MLTMPCRGSRLSWIILDAGNRNFDMSCRQSSSPYFFLSMPSQVNSARQRRRWPVKTHWKAEMAEAREDWTCLNHSSSVCTIFCTSIDRESCSYSGVGLHNYKLVSKAYQYYELLPFRRCKSWQRKSKYSIHLSHWVEFSSDSALSHKPSGRFINIWRKKWRGLSAEEVFCRLTGVVSEYTGWTESELKATVLLMYTLDTSCYM